MADLPPRERPREKAIAQGLAALADRDLLALILGTGAQGESALDIADRLLASFRSLRGLAMADPASLCGIRAVSEAKALALGAAFELGRRLQREPLGRRGFSAEEVFESHRLFFLGLNDEVLLLLLYDRRLFLLGERELGRGSESGVMASPKGSLGAARAARASGFALIHNHPSCEPSPSPSDVAMTLELKAKAEAVGLAFLDHLIIAGDRYCSLKERGCL
jgi:DNA repair protein RadC